MTMEGLTDAFCAEHEYIRDLGATVLTVDKVGGGTLGRQYDGSWFVSVYDRGGRLQGDVVDVVTGMPHTHWWVADLFEEMQTEEV